MITFTALAGAAGQSDSQPLCYLLQIDDVRILLDCGSSDWVPEATPDRDDAEQRWESYAERLRETCPTVDLVLLSHGDLSHSGFYPYAYARWGLKAPTYTTLPVQAMARIAVTEDVDGIREEQDIGDEPEKPQDDSNPDTTMAIDSEKAEEAHDSKSPPPTAKKTGKYVATVAEVQEAFDSVNTLRYSQPTHLQGKCQGMTIIPFNAGHTLGGAIWKIRSPSSGTIVYSVHMNHMKERHLDGTVLTRQSAGGVFEPLARPDLLITDADRVNVTTCRRKDRDAALLDTVTTTLSSRLSILLPCDSSTRVLELLVLLDQHWNYSRLRYPICFLSRSASEMLTFVRSMMEWLGGTISKEDVGEDASGKQERKRKRGDDDADDEALGAFALRFKHLEFFPNPQALIEKHSSKEPKLILAVPASLSHGPSRHLFSDFASIPDNVVLLTCRGEEGTLGRVLFDRWNDSQRPENKWDNGKIGISVMMDGSMKLKMHSKVPLQGTELESHLQKEKEKREKEAAQQAAIDRNRLILEADEDESDSDSDEGSDINDDDDLMLEGHGKGQGQQNGDLQDWNMDVDEGLTKQYLSFDIYLKGNVSKASSFFKSSGRQTQRFRMFPYVEKKKKVDEYGETIDVGMWLRKGKVFEEEAESEEARELKRKQAEIDAKAVIDETPSKFVCSEVEIQLACRLLFIDMEGLNDGRAMKMIIPQVSPRKMILIHASIAATDALIDSCSNIRSMTKDIYAPSVGESVQIGQQTNSFSISISDELLLSMKLSRFEDNEVGYLTGRVIALPGSTVPILEPVGMSNRPKQAQKASDTVGLLGYRPPLALPSSTMIGELKLTSLKSRLTAAGIHAELAGEGVLVCRGASDGGNLTEAVAVRKTAKGRVELEGFVSDLYYAVRKEIYNMHALISA